MPRQTARLCPGCPNGSELIADDDTRISYASVDGAAVCAFTRFIVDRRGSSKRYAYMPLGATINDIAKCHDPVATNGSKYSTGPIIGCGASLAAEERLILSSTYVI